MAHDSPGERLIGLWRRLAPLPGGRRLFALLLGRTVPYSGTVGARVEKLEPGHATLRLRDRRSVRNHLGSIHAIALANLGELASGLATVTALPPGVRGIVLGIEVEYRKKARGTLRCDTRSAPPDVVAEPLDHRVEAEIRDGAGDVVALVRVRWRLAPMR